MTEPSIRQETSIGAIPARLASATRATRPAAWRRSATVDDIALGGYLVAQALTEIRSLADSSTRPVAPASDELSDEPSDKEVFSRIRFLANLCDNVPSCTEDVIRIRALAYATGRREAASDGGTNDEVLSRIRSLAPHSPAIDLTSVRRHVLEPASGTGPRRPANHTFPKNPQAGHPGQLEVEYSRPVLAGQMRGVGV